MSEHTIAALVSDFLNDGWRVECSCGWRSSAHKFISAANLDFKAHKAEASTSADGRA